MSSLLAALLGAAGRGRLHSGNNEAEVLQEPWKAHPVFRCCFSCLFPPFAGSWSSSHQLTRSHLKVTNSIDPTAIPTYLRGLPPPGPRQDHGTTAPSGSVVSRLYPPAKMRRGLSSSL